MFTHKFLLIALAVYYAVVLLPALANPKRFSKAVKNMVSDESRVRMMGIMVLIISMIYLSVQHTFTKDWAVLIPILGWAAFIKGVVMIWHPDHFKKMWKKIGSEHAVAIISILGIIIAVALCYVAKELLPGYEIVAG
ncbi:hypothetical protein HN709_04390 [Candidatus Peregrinibacteria bacterium]|jgi:hypothetical protein|nr:hypothetical protein [Candidatus Peregrinibacteria bacterium]MBT7736903.1 hypothetical protein [Candidatus Peregrinibacteria bacterium]